MMIHSAGKGPSVAQFFKVMHQCKLKEADAHTVQQPDSEYATDAEKNFFTGGNVLRQHKRQPEAENAEANTLPFYKKPVTRFGYQHLVRYNRSFNTHQLRKEIGCMR